MSNICLADLLTLEKLEQGLYRGQSWDLGFRALFGGQVMGQALAAAQATVEQHLTVHSFHSYFLLPGQSEKPVVYDVEGTRDGRSFSTRRVKAIQNGRVIFNMTASFHIHEDGLAHQHSTMPAVPRPETLKSELESFQSVFDKMPQSIREKLKYHEPIDMRSVQSISPVDATVTSPIRYVWMRAQEKLPQDLRVQQNLLAYASDYYFLMTAVQPHGMAVMNHSLQMASLDHAMWFHRPFHFNQWLLYCMESPIAGGARGLVRGQIFDESGHLVASTMQEGLMRQSKGE